MAEKTAAKEALQKVEDQLECAICLQPYKDPKLLTCFHVFCTHCLERIVTPNRDGSTVTCPKCRHVTTLTQNTVTALQSAFHIAHLFDIRDTLEKAKEPHKTTCEGCGGSSVTGFCCDCGKFICEKCIQFHQTWKEFTTHKVVGLSEVQKEASKLVSPTKKVLYCSKHTDNVLKIYCETCKELICTDCTIRLHQGHHNDLVTDTFPKHRDQLQAHLQPVRQQLDTVNTALTALDTRAKEIGDQRIAVEEDIHQHIDQLHQALDRRREELVGHVDTLTQRKLKSLAAQRNHMELLQTQLTSCLEYVEGSLTTSTPAEILALEESAVKQIQEMTANIKADSLAPTEEANLILVAAEGLQQQCLQYGMVHEATVYPSQCHVTGVGSRMAKVNEEASLTLQTADNQGKDFSISVKDISAELVHCTERTTTQCEVTRKAKGNYTVTYTPTTRGRHQLHIKVGQVPIGCSPLPVVVRLPVQRLGNPVRTIRGLKEPQGVSMNPTGQILVSNGDHISVYTQEGQKVQTFGKINAPWGVCLDSDNNILVAGHTDHQIHKFSSDGKHIQSVGTRGNNPLQFNWPIGIAYSNKTRKIYISEHSNHRIQVLNEDLTFSSTIGAQGSGNGQLLYPWGLTLDSNSNVYVADVSNRRIHVFTPDGQFVRVFGTMGSGPGQIDFPTDVHVDGTNTVYVTEHNNHRVSVFTADGQFLTSFGQGQLQKPYGITMDDDGYVIVCDISKRQLCIF